ncbi:MAG: CBS domain-containing protein [Flavobacteriales bacterium]|nr:CBS domain-containing protein [Flavobacteriales bacterium]
MGIKSFQGKFVGQDKSPTENIRVCDFMSTTLTTFRPEQTIPQVIEILIRNRISGGPVVNERYELVGIISEGDCIKQLSDSQYYNMPIENIRVEDCMVKDIETIDGNCTIFDAAKLFLNAKRRRFPIVDDGKLVGMISQKDILKASLKMNSQTWDRNK